MKQFLNFLTDISINNCWNPHPQQVYGFSQDWWHYKTPSHQYCSKSLWRWCLIEVIEKLMAYQGCQVRNCQKSLGGVLKKGVFKRLAKFIGKHLCQSLFLIKLQAEACNRRSGTFDMELFLRKNQHKKILSIFLANIHIHIFIALKQSTGNSCIVWLGVIHLLRLQNFPKTKISYPLVRTRRLRIRR